MTEYSHLNSIAYLEHQARLKKSQEKVLNKKREKANRKCLKPKAIKWKEKKTKTRMTFSSDETDPEIYLESEEEPAMNSEDKDIDEN